MLTVKISTDVHQKMKVIAAQRKQTLREMVEEALRRHVSRPARKKVAA